MPAAPGAPAVPGAPACDATHVWWQRRGGGCMCAGEGGASGRGSTRASAQRCYLWGRGSLECRKAQWHEPAGAGGAQGLSAEAGGVAIAPSRRGGVATRWRDAFEPGRRQPEHKTKLHSAVAACSTYAGGGAPAGSSGCASSDHAPERGTTRGLIPGPQTEDAHAGEDVLAVDVEARPDGVLEGHAKRVLREPAATHHPVGRGRRGGGDQRCGEGGARDVQHLQRTWKSLSQRRCVHVPATTTARASVRAIVSLSVRWAWRGVHARAAVG